MDLQVEPETSLSAPLAHITQMTGAKVRVFLTEVAEGTSNYRSLHSLTQQVEHQYHGRFLIELIQNAHDAFDASLKDIGNRIAVVFDSTDSPHGSLLVANDGLPFSQSNFDRLSQLGQSDKDPQKSIGNKGIGFRSVLEVSNSPEIYSRLSPESKTFDGYCFAFRPDVVESLDIPINLLAHTDNVPQWSVTGQPLVESWSDEMLMKYRAKVRSREEGWLSGETRYLSPYLLPIPLTDRLSARVVEFESQGFSTVIRLPLKSGELHASVLERMDELDARTLLFLEKLSVLRISDGSRSRNFTRKAEPLDGDQSGSLVVIESGDAEVAEYGFWKRDLHVSTASEKFRKAIAALPGRWPEIQDISTSVAVRFGATPEAGRYSIYLPTRVPTGSAVHINAPFFGDMSRTSIDFEDTYNEQLRNAAVDLAVEVVRKCLAGKGQVEACAIVDFLAPFGAGPAGKNWLELIDEAAKRASASLTKEPLTLCERGWKAWNLSSLIPTLRDATCLTEDRLRRHATFEVFHGCLDSRLDQVKAWAEAKFSDGANPTEASLAKTIASVAREIYEQGGDWNVFWHEVASLMPKGQGELAKHEVLLGTDGTLHRATDGMKIFFLPRQGTQDDSDVGNEAGAINVPQSLRSSVAFVSDEIQMYDVNRPSLQTPARAYLGSNGYVSQFRVETIFSEILLQAAPSLPAPIEGEHYERCREILSWALRLMANIVARGRGVDATLKLLGSIPVPCEGGWFPMKDASFGTGWANTAGDVLQTYLMSLASSDASEARKRVLLPPEHPAWRGASSAEVALLRSGGVFNGLRLQEIRSSTWQSGFTASAASFQLPANPPAAFPRETWVEWAAVAQGETRPTYKLNQPYQVGNVFVFPGMVEWRAMPDDARVALSELILESLPNWGAGLEKLAVSKHTGQWERLVVTSPLTYFLRESAWMAIREQKGLVWASPGQRWFVPADVLTGRARHFAHLRALPIVMARAIAQHPTLLDSLRFLGMPVFDPHTNTSSPALLDALTAAVDSDEFADTNILLGQIRDAWQRFRPGDARKPLRRLPVRRRDKRLTAITPTPQEPALIPDTKAFTAELEEFDFPVVAIEVADARELRDWFVGTYQDSVQFTSTLSLVPKVNGSRWTDAHALPIAESELSWLLRPLLVLAAHGRGVHSAAFEARVKVLRALRVDWVPSLHVAVWRGDTELATSAVDALWESEQKTLVITEACKTRLEAISAALAQALERDDLELPLRFLLRNVTSVDEAPEDVASFLAPLRTVTPEQVHEVLEHIKGDIGHMARLVSILVAVLCPGADLTPLSIANTEEELGAALAQLDVPSLDVARVLQAAHDSPDLFDFGRTVSKDFGGNASLARWNQVLSEQGQAALSNRQWALQLQASLEEAAFSVKRVIAHAIGQGAKRMYAQMRQEYVELVTAANLSQSHWSVEFPDAMALVANLAKGWLDDEMVILAIRNAESNEQLMERLAAAGISMDFDPDECSRNNNALFEEVAVELDKLHVAIWVRSRSERPEQGVQSFIDRYRAAAAVSLASDAFVTRWTESRVIALLKDVKYPDLPEFEAAVAASADLASLRSALNISTDELVDVRDRLEAIKAAWMRKRRMVDICGDSFDSSEDNLHNLWSFLSERIPDANLDHVRLDLSKLSALGPGRSKRSKPDRVTPPTSAKHARPPKAMEELVGLAGEIHVFRMLRKMYGNDAVTASAWVSENSLKVFPSNLTDDGRGCDFAFTVKGKQYRIEVKASAGNDESFTMGSSEIRLAMDIGSKSRRRREIFRIVHVTNALSPSPSIVVLPNPYDSAFADSFRIEEADARVRYWKK
ncbi:hypothetical protein U0F71_05470 [Burkholderia pseudomallei]|uniref:sacsin N-terminal ATP-binding-like domain-containing protein n=1 Tax=Burkholderia pseudomallei TaxID=28450 RepID=UPI002AB4B5CC|nr:hypothetical protein [Burkholderia pseudomallei]MDY7815168.1 hypothetical protein [Burkholderia pseudomallei]MDY7861729.1 hypothetical protein [Burkholderia pseudomallei]